MLKVSARTGANLDALVAYLIRVLPLGPRYYDEDACTDQTERMLAQEAVREQVWALHAACPQGGYICSPSDHFFFGDPRNLQAFVDATRACTYA